MALSNEHLPLRIRTWDLPKSTGVNMKFADVDMQHSNDYPTRTSEFHDSKVKLSSNINKNGAVVWAENTSENQTIEYYILYLPF